MEIYLKKEQNSAEWLQRPNINMMIDNVRFLFRWFPASKKLSEIREMYKFVAYKEIKEEWKNLTDKDIMEAYGDYAKGRSEYIYTKKDMEETVAKAIEDKVKECEMMRKSVQQSAEKIIKMMGWSLSSFDLDGSNVNKDRQTPVLFEEIQKANVEQVVVKEKVISPVSSKSLDEEEIVDIINKYRKNASLNRVSKDVPIGPVTSGHVTPDKVVNQNCSSRLPEIKKEEISEDEKIGQKRVSKEEVSRGDISSSDSDGESGSENIATEVACKKSGQVGKVAMKNVNTTIYKF
ncbi:hypothetical protein RhiirA5_384378 [Rhizophagus irregularis]|uniref:Uncharacterized protein n=1 Tax=Rhizophagus irregularis TaxID=588596 RepID=A0A2N0NTE4_9GLOM|nr:hypothetical protein RhiirA5_384378 [Rhizophagus irregularis]